MFRSTVSIQLFIHGFLETGVKPAGLERTVCYYCSFYRITVHPQVHTATF
jgi:hypothetical protein